ncbi:MAG: hypothetical protein HFH47_00230 [Bacilli bacterium]|nr:hypothetical protein [Bacilli bacterium]
MERKLPSVFANKIEKEVGNNKNVFYSSKDGLAERGEDLKDSKQTDDFAQKAKDNLIKPKNIYQKLNEIFSSSRYVYKADVEITLKDGVVTKRIIGKNANHLITIDNELIPISDIVDIKHK